MTPRDPGGPLSRQELLRLGFQEPGPARERLEALGEAAGPLLAMLGRTADPDQALAGLGRLVESSPEAPALVGALADDEGTAMRLLMVLGASQALTDHLVRHPGQWRELADPGLGSTRPAAYAVRGALLAAVGAEPTATDPVATLPAAEAPDALRVEYRRHLLRLAARDLAHQLPVDDAAAELSDLAAGTLDAALAIARARVGDEARTARLAVIAMGKCGGHELNYVSDVDVIFVAEPAAGAGETAALKVAAQLASVTMQVCSDHTAEGTIWPVDAALRPEGKAGPLVRTLASHRGYYERWAKTWEFQALLKARPVAGDLELGQAFADLVTPLVFTVGAALIAYASRMAGRLHPAELGRPTDVSAVALRRAGTALVFAVIVANVFWATATVAQWSGRGLAHYQATHLDHLPSVILDTQERLYLRSPGIEETVLPPEEGQTFHYRYRHLRLLIQGRGLMFLVPDQWSASNSTLVVPLDDSVRVQFQFRNDAP